MNKPIESAGEPVARRCSEGPQRSPAPRGTSATRGASATASPPPAKPSASIDLVDELRRAAGLQISAGHGLANAWISGGGAGRCPAEADCSRLANLLSRAAEALQVARQPAEPAPVALVQPTEPVMHGFGVGPSLAVSAGSGIHQLVFDALCLMSAGMATLNTVVERADGNEDDFDCSLLWGAVYLLRQSFAVIETAASIPEFPQGAA